MNPNPQQEALEAVHLARELGCAIDRPLAKDDKESNFDREAWNRLFDSEFIHGFLPTEYGGKAWSTRTAVSALEAFGESCRDAGLCLGLSSFVWTILPPILSAASKSQARTWLSEIASKRLIVADGVSEPQAGSDVMALQTKAIRYKDGYLLSGHKSYIGFAPIADRILVFARIDGAEGPWGISTFYIPSDIPGIIRSPNRDKQGLRTLPMGNIEFQDCFVGEECRVGEEGVGLSLFNEAMQWERSFILATQVGAMKRQLDQCIEHARNREQFGKQIKDFQSVSNRIADMRVRLEQCRLMLQHCAQLKDQGENIALQSSIAKLTISEAQFASSLDAVRIHGAKGYLSEFEIERDLRNATGGLLYAGTSDIQRNLIAKLIGL
ncbi:MAG: acyl-CoA dehydrogenase family protein [Verrucomicrobiota bacterium]